MAQTQSCEVCKCLEGFNEPISVRSLLESAEIGCPGCSLLKDSICSFMDSLEEADHIILVLDMSIFVLVVTKQGATLTVLELYTLQDHPVIWSKLGPARTVSENSSSDDCLALAKRWLDGCLSSHPTCTRISTPTLPTRVIKVGACDEETRLYVSGSEEKAEYAALSHSWGNGKPITLTEATFEEMEGRMIFDDASRTFKDAVHVTRRLGIPYLWIDSLCIIQDSKDLVDWEMEAPLMGDVYSGATVTLFAASSTSAADGLFPKPNDRLTRNKSTKLASTNLRGEPEFVYVRVRNEDPFNTQEIVHSSSKLEDPHLCSRGWVLQEEQLSPRILHFRNEELAWSCSTYSRCECRVRPSLPIAHPFRASLGTRPDSWELKCKLNAEWPPLVMDYTRRMLTKVSDRSMALAGLANYRQRQTSDTYFCGLWYEDMVFQMLWYVDRRSCNGPVPERIKDPLAPSWSWLSVPAPISYFERHPAGMVRSHQRFSTGDAIEPLLRANGKNAPLMVGIVPLNPDNTFGSILAAPLLLGAYVLPVQFDIATNGWHPMHPIDDFVPGLLRVYIDVEKDLPELNQSADYVFLLVGRWVGMGMTLSCAQAVCILARRLSQEAEPTLEIARDFQRRILEDESVECKPNVDIELANSYQRIGLVRGAGSIKAWEKANLPADGVYLF